MIANNENVGNTLGLYDVVWDSPSKDCLGSMPLGNGDIGINLWVDEDGLLQFYVGKTDTWSEIHRLLKVAKINVFADGNKHAVKQQFKQTLDLQTGTVNVEMGEGESRRDYRIWVDANNPVVWVDLHSASPVDMSVELDTWRNKENTMPPGDHSVQAVANAPFALVESADTALARGNELVWYHRNEHSVFPAMMQHQGLETLTDKVSDPIINRTFGGVIAGENLMAADNKILQSISPQTSFRIGVHLLTSQAVSVDDWLSDIDLSRKKALAVDVETAYSEHAHWWGEFWDRSHIFVSGSDDAHVVTRGYVLQRFINACAGRGARPIKFNGSLFTVPMMDESCPNIQPSPDYRRWGDCYWFQNTRLGYWPMIASGDYDLMQPFFKMYLDILPLCKERTRIYFGHNGAFFPEVLTEWGCYSSDNYGWDREGKAAGEVENTYIRWYWQGGLELVAMMLDYYDHTRDREFVVSTLLPIAREVMFFYREHYPRRDDDGKVMIAPAQSLETWQEAVNPTPEIAGLHFDLAGLLSLPTDMTTAEDCADWREFLDELPPVPTRYYYWLKQREIIPALQYDKNYNWENPELYAVFPYRIYGIGKDVEVGRLTYEKRVNKSKGGWGGWYQDAIQAAMLGLTDEAKDLEVSNFSTKHESSRFPAFWGPNYDWVPDQDHGNVAVNALQKMLLQYDGDDLHILPAWPKDWDVDFSLFAPGRTRVECKLRDGRIEKLDIECPDKAWNTILPEW